VEQRLLKHFMPNSKAIDRYYGERSETPWEKIMPKSKALSRIRGASSVRTEIDVRFNIGLYARCRTWPYAINSAFGNVREGAKIFGNSLPR